MKLMILDGNSIINRAFYGIRMLNAPDGTPTNAVYGFLSTFRRVFDLAQPQAVCVAFDVHAPTFRHEQYALYKAQRKPMPEELAVQMPLLKQTLDYMGVRRLELAGWEADDLLGTVARRCEAAGWTCDVVTGDKDSLQLITDSTHVFNVKTRMGQTDTIEYTPERFREEYGFDPIRMIDLKALMGDSSDNIPAGRGGLRHRRRGLRRGAGLHRPAGCACTGTCVPQPAQVPDRQPRSGAGVRRGDDRRYARSLHQEGGRQAAALHPAV